MFSTCHKDSFEARGILTGFVPEEALLIQCSRVKMSEAAIAAASHLLQQALNWSYILEISIRHGTAPLFYYGLKQVLQATALDEYVPAPILEELQTLYLGNQARNRRLYRVIMDMVKAFDRTGVPVMALKDLQLAWEVYPDIGLRPIGDLDILIHPEDYPAVAARLAELGFIPLPDRDIPFTLKYAWTYDFRRPEDNIWVDVQWNILHGEWDIYKEGPFDSVVEAMWAGASLMSVDDVRLLAPAPEDMFFHLCLHLEGHQYCELILFCDIVELLSRYENQFDWGYLLKITKARQAESSIFYVLFLLQQLFRISLPPNLLQQLRPAYFKANLFDPLFGNLSALHVSLDEIYLASSPPDEVLRKFETVVRRQTAGAMKLYGEIDKLASAFINAGGTVIIFSGAVSEKVLPDPSLTPFKELFMLVLDDDLPRLRHLLAQQGFNSENTSGAETYLKAWDFVSVDPALTNQPTRFKLQVDIETGLDHLPALGAAKYSSKKELTFRILKSKLGGDDYDESCIPLPIKIIALRPEEMIVFLTTQVARQRQNRLFGLCNVFEFFRRYPDPLDWQQVVDLAERLRVRQLAYEGLLLVKAVLDNDQVPPLALNGLLCPEAQPRVLEWARQEPASLARYTAFKRAFFYLYSFLSAKGINMKYRYLIKSLIGDQDCKPILPRLILELGPALVGCFRKKRYTNRDLVYWIESL